MATCQQVASFFDQVATRQAPQPLAPADEALLVQCQLAQFLTADEYRTLQSTVAGLGSAQDALSQEQAQRESLADLAADDQRKTEGVLFHLEGKKKQAQTRQSAADAEEQLKSVDVDLARKSAALSQIVQQRTLLDTLIPYGDRFTGVTSLGLVERRNLAVRLYRVSDSDFSAYWAESQKLRSEMTDLSDRGAGYFAQLGPAIPGADRAHLWGISIGLAQATPDVAGGSARFVQVYNQIAALSGNPENRLLSAEALVSLPRPLDSELDTLRQLVSDVVRLDVPRESALGIASLLLLGQRADGTLALQELQQYLGVTRSYESAALLAILNAPFPDLSAKFQSLRTMFTGWGYQVSEDVELASAYLAVSELPADGVATKLAIVAKGMAAYLEYPLVAASVLTALSTLEANETLNLLEQAYAIVGRRAMPMTQPELVCLAVRLLHGVRNQLVGPLDATAARAPTAAVTRGPGYYYGPRFFYAPIIVAHYGYYSTYSGIGGFHPGHVHGFGGGFGGG